MMLQPQYIKKNCILKVLDIDIAENGILVSDGVMKGVITVFQEGTN